ncbi:Cys-tRNA(Pro) deacylase YbaK [hydrothermal vent metagenome]|uniref:Cys-tRNA(Pro) deacylase YbaK n=1 Tax=hydrothermal vent metagenome TaxID=652676 RepID=A0A1W1EBN8_9ZZZZ
MTPAINEAKKSKIEYTVHEYHHDPLSDSYGLEAASKLGVESERVYKTLVIVHGDKELAVGIVPVSSMLNMKLIAKVLGSKKAAMAETSDVERSTGYILGGVSPLGQKKKLITIVDSSATKYKTIFVSAGRRGLDIELKANDLLLLTKGRFETICQ